MPSALATAQGYHLDDPDGGLDGLTLRETPVSRPGPTEVVIKIRAASLNRRDVMILDLCVPRISSTDLTCKVAFSLVQP